MRIVSGLQPGHVLQRRPGGANITVGGACADSGMVLASVRRNGRCLPGWRDRPVGRAADGEFTARLVGVPPGGPYEVALVCGKSRVVVPDVFVGDLWLMAGQSNMEGCAILPGPAEPHPLVRCFTMGRRWEQARDPLHLKAESPDEVHGGAGVPPAVAERLRRRARAGGGVGIAFARALLERTGVPQGLIATAHGGTSMTQWDPARAAKAGASLYGSLLLSVRAIGQPLAGVLWAQGESEALPELARVYTRRMRRLVAALRRDVGQPQLPWLLVQAGRFIDIRHTTGWAWPDPHSWNRVQEQQRRLPDLIPHSAVVGSIDLELDDCAHLDSASLGVLATRLAAEAARLVHGDRLAPPVIRPLQPRCRGACIELDFAHVVGGLRSAGPARGFALLTPGGTPLPAIHKVRVQGSRATIHLACALRRGTALCYGHGLDPVCTLSDARGMGMPVFGPLTIVGL